MHELRSAITSGQSLRSTPLASKEACRRREGGFGGSLITISIPREERRATNQRREDRYRGVVDSATLFFRRRKIAARVVNLSESGVMVEADLMPRIGETIGVEFEGFERLQGVVRWIREGRIGLDVGEGSIDLG